MYSCIYIKFRGDATKEKSQGLKPQLLPSTRSELWVFSPLTANDVVFKFLNRKISPLRLKANNVPKKLLAVFVQFGGIPFSVKHIANELTDHDWIFCVLLSA